MTDTTKFPPGDEVPVIPDDQPAVDAKAAATFRRRLARASDMSVTDAAKMHIRAQRAHLAADRLEERGDRIGSRLERAEAAELKAVAELAIDSLTHGRVVAGAGEAVLSKSGFADTLREATNMLPIEASQKRMELAEEAGCLELGIDAAATIGARDSLEKALAHQMAGAHRLGMQMMAQAVQLLERFDGSGHVALSVESARLATCASKLMFAFQGGMATIARLRGGGQQTVVVQHLQQVAVGKGGRAAVIGQARSKRRKGEG